MTVLQPRPAERSPVRTTFLVGWLVVAVCVMGDGLRLTILDEARLELWAGCIFWSVVAPIFPVFLLVDGFASSWLMALGFLAYGLLPFLLVRLSRRVGARMRVVMCCGMAAWWLSVGGLILAYLEYAAGR